MDLAAYLAAAQLRLADEEGFLPVDGPLPGAAGALVHTLLHRRDEGAGAELFVALIPAGSLAPGELAAVAEYLRDLAAWYGGRPGAGVPLVVAVFVFPHGVDDAARAHLARLRLAVPGGGVVLPWAADLATGQLHRHPGPPRVPGLDALADFTPADVPSGGGAAVAVVCGDAPVPYATYGLLVLIAAAYLWVLTGGSAEDARNLIRHGANDPRRVLWDGEYWRLLTALFLHGGPVHLLGNSLVLLQTGRLVEALFGRWRFLFIYLVAGLSGSVLSVIQGDFYRPSVGASGAIFGLFGAMVFYRADAPQGHRIPWSSLLWPIAINLSLGLVIEHVDNWAHVGGLLGGLLAAVVAGLPAPARPWRLVAVGAVLGAALLLLAGRLPVSNRGASLELGRQALVAGRLADAEAYLRQAQALGPRDWRPHYYLAVLFAQQGRREDALAQARVAADLNPGQPEVERLIRALDPGRRGGIAPPPPNYE